MKIIAHRANIDGPNPLTENMPEQIDKAISMGYDVEIDLRYDILTGMIHLGHDDPQYDVDWYWLGARKDRLWIHCKNLEALLEFSRGTSGFNYFWHQTDSYTLTSTNKIWTYPGNPYTSKSIIVMPESYMNKDNLKNLIAYDCYGVCTDYPQLIKK
jgi:hypothetical protein